MLTLCPNCITTRSNWKCSEVAGTSSDIFGNIWKSSENCLQSSEVAAMFPEIEVMTTRKIEQTINNNAEIAGHADQQLSLEWSHLVPYHRLKSLWLSLGYLVEHDKHQHRKVTLKDSIHILTS